MKPANKDGILDFFRDMDRLLDGIKRSEKIRVYLFGGAAAVIAYGSRRGTLDIDAYVDERTAGAKLMAEAGRGTELEKKYGFYFHKANTELMLIEAPDWKTRSVELFKGKFKNIRIMALSKEDLILSKLSRYNDRDREDIKYLIETHRVRPERLVARYKAARQYYAGDLAALDTTFNIVLREYFAIPPRRFA